MNSSLYVTDRNATKEAIAAQHGNLGSWRAVGEFYGVNSTTCWRAANDPDYEPKDQEIREKLGFPSKDQIVSIGITYANGRVVNVEVPKE